MRGFFASRLTHVLTFLLGLWLHMSSFRVPAFLRPRRSFHRLKSFHLSPAEVKAMANSQARRGGTKSPSLNQPDASNAMQIGPRPTPGNLVIPLRGGTIVTLAIISSLFFIMSLSFAFIGADAGEPYFKHMLDTVGEASPGVYLIIFNMYHSVPDN